MTICRSLTMCAAITLLASCTARNTQSNYYNDNLSPIPQSQNELPPSSSPIIESPGATSDPGPTMEGPALLGPEANRQRRAQPTRSSGTDPWGRPRRQAPQIRNTIRHKVEHQTLWETQYQSSGRRPIQTVQLGIGPTRVMVIPSLSGTEPSSVTIVEQLAHAVSNRADIQNACSVLFVRNPNPDGVALQTAENGRGVDLRRNFPAENWRSSADGKAGPKAGSELETRVLVRLIDDFQPDRIVVVQNALRKGDVSYAGPARQLARIVAMKTGYRTTNQAAAVSGSLEAYAGHDRRLAVIVVNVDRTLDGRTAWGAHADGLFAALTSPDPRTQYPGQEEPVIEDDPQAPVARTRSYSLPLNINGGAEQRSKSRLEAPRPSKGIYYELPKP